MSNEIIDELRDLLKRLEKEHNIPASEAIAKAMRQDHVPVSIFSTERGPLEALVIFLRDQGNLDFPTIAAMLHRSYSTIWTSYKQGTKKDGAISLSASQQHVLANLRSAELYVPYHTFSSRSLSIFETLVHHLHTTQGMRLRDIATLLNRDERTIWTLQSRASKKVNHETP